MREQQFFRNRLSAGPLTASDWDRTWIAINWVEAADEKIVVRPGHIEQLTTGYCVNLKPISTEGYEERRTLNGVARMIFASGLARRAI